MWQRQVRWAKGNSLVAGRRDTLGGPDLFSRMPYGILWDFFAGSGKRAILLFGARIADCGRSINRFLGVVGELGWGVVRDGAGPRRGICGLFPLREFCWDLRCGAASLLEHEPRVCGAITAIQLISVGGGELCLRQGTVRKGICDDADSGVQPFRHAVLGAMGDLC